MLLTISSSINFSKLTNILKYNYSFIIQIYLSTILKYTKINLLKLKKSLNFTQSLKIEFKRRFKKIFLLKIKI